MKIMTILGTRPEIIRLSLVIPKLDKLCQHVFVYTGQNFELYLSEIFFSELELRPPNYILNCKSDSTMGQLAAILQECEKVILKEMPDRLLVLGDTNSALSSIAAKRLGIPVFHMEAGNRCYDDRVPEEINRRIVDHCSDILMPYTERSRFNLLREGIPGHRIYVTGNPIYEVLEHYSDKIENSMILQKFGVNPGGYFLVTLHRAENVDIKYRLLKFIEAFHRLYGEYGIPVLCSLHPRTRSQLEKHGIRMDTQGIRTFEPLGLFDFVCFEKNAACVLTDSGTVQEECCILGVPNVTLRDVTERPETVEAGSNLITGCEPDDVIKSVEVVLNEKYNWKQPQEYMVGNVSGTVTKIILSRHLSVSGVYTGMQNICREVPAEKTVDAWKVLGQGERYDPTLGASINWQDLSHVPRYEFAREYITPADTVLDISCGTGYGAFIIAGHCKKVIGVDYSGDALEYAKSHYKKDNIEFVQSDFFSNFVTADVVISFGTLEHIPANDFKLVLDKLASWARYKIIGSVPYKEPAGNNRFHIFTGLEEKDFVSLQNFGKTEFFYQTADGVIHKQIPDAGVVLNMIFVCTRECES